MTTSRSTRPWHAVAVRHAPGRAPRRPEHPANAPGPGGPVALPPVALRPRPPAPGRPLDADDVGTLLHRIAGLSRFLWRRTSETLSAAPPRDTPTTVVGRPVPSGGRCYPLEVTLALGGVDGVPSGLYRYDPLHHRLLPLVTHDVRAELSADLAVPPRRVPDLLLVVSAVEERATALYGRLGRRLAALEAGAMAFQAVAAGRTVGLAGSVHLRGGDRNEASAAASDAGGEQAAVIAFESVTRRSPTGAPNRTALAAAIDLRASTVAGYHRGDLTHHRARAFLGALRAPAPVDAPHLVSRLLVATQRVPGSAFPRPGRSEGSGSVGVLVGPSVLPALANAATSRVLQRECLEANFVVVAFDPGRTDGSAPSRRSPDLGSVSSGMALQQAALAAAAAGLGSRVHCDFDTLDVRRVLNLPPDDDGAAVLLTVGQCPADRVRPGYPL
ncbi:nitroreductase family protein [Streptomyces sp. NPDC055607]